VGSPRAALSSSDPASVPGASGPGLDPDESPLPASPELAWPSRLPVFPSLLALPPEPSLPELPLPASRVDPLPASLVDSLPASLVDSLPASLVDWLPDPVPDELPRAARAAPLGVPTPVGPSHPTPATHITSSQMPVESLVLPSAMSLKAIAFAYTNPRSAPTWLATPMRAKMPATSGAAALVPTTCSHPPSPALAPPPLPTAGDW